VYGCKVCFSQCEGDLNSSYKVLCKSHGRIWSKSLRSAVRLVDTRCHTLIVALLFVYVTHYLFSCWYSSVAILGLRCEVTKVAILCVARNVSYVVRPQGWPSSAWRAMCEKRCEATKVAIICVARNVLHFSFIVIGIFLQYYTDYIGCFFSCLTYKRQPGALVIFIRPSKEFYNCRRLLYLPETRRTTQRWQSSGQNVGSALVSQVGKKTLYTYRNKVPGVKHV